MVRVIAHWGCGMRACGARAHARSREGGDTELEEGRRRVEDYDVDRGGPLQEAVRMCVCWQRHPGNGGGGERVGRHGCDTSKDTKRATLLCMSARHPACIARSTWSNPRVQWRTARRPFNAKTPCIIARKKVPDHPSSQGQHVSFRAGQQAPTYDAAEERLNALTSINMGKMFECALQ